MFSTALVLPMFCNQAHGAYLPILTQSIVPVVLILSGHQLINQTIQPEVFFFGALYTPSMLSCSSASFTNSVITFSILLAVRTSTYDSSSVASRRGIPSADRLKLIPTIYTPFISDVRHKRRISFIICKIFLQNYLTIDKYCDK